MILIAIVVQKSVPEERTGVRNAMTEQHFLLHHNTQFSSKSRSVAHSKQDLV